MAVTELFIAEATQARRFRNGFRCTSTRDIINPAVLRQIFTIQFTPTVSKAGRGLFGSDVPLRFCQHFVSVARQYEWR